MRALLAIALLAPLSAGAQGLPLPLPGPEFRPAPSTDIIFTAPLRTSGHISRAQTCAPSIEFLPSASAVVATTGAGVNVPMTAGTGSIVSTIFNPTIGGTARYAYEGTGVTSGSYVTTSSDFASIWTGDFTLRFVFRNMSAGQTMPISHGLAAVDGIYCYTTNPTTFGCILSNGATVYNPTTGGGSGKWLAATLKRSSGSCTLRANGTTGTPVACPAVTAPTTRKFYVGQYETGAAQAGPFAYGALYACATTDAEDTSFSNAWFGSLGDDRPITDTRASDACWEPPDGNIDCLGNNALRVDSRGGLSEATATNIHAKIDPCATFTSAAGTGSCSDANASGPARRWRGSNDASLFTDSDGAAQYGRSFSPGMAAGTHTHSVYFKAGTLTEFELWSYEVPNGVQRCTFTSLTTTPATSGTGCVVRATGLAGWYRASHTKAVAINAAYYLMGGDAAADQGTIYFAAPQIEDGAIATQWVPTAVASATRLGDAVTVSSAGIPVQSGELEFTYTPEWSSGSGFAVGQSIVSSYTGFYRGFYVGFSNTNTGTAAILTGLGASYTSSTTGALTVTAFTPYRYRARWGDGNHWLSIDNVLRASNVTGSAFMPDAIPATMQVGGVNGWLSFDAVRR
jgi:hypothetical protein